jgi:uncharacterized repeat protein (TIGR02543 family)
MLSRTALLAHQLAGVYPRKLTLKIITHLFSTSITNSSGEKMNAVGLRGRLMLHAGLLLALVGGLGVSTVSTPPAVASTPTSSLSVYLDAPFIQGSYVTQDALSMSFNGPTGAGQCGSGQPAGITIAGACQIYPAASHGGATTLASDASPTVGGPGSNFPSTNHPTNPITITLASDSRYLGLWWPSGSPGNVMEFYKGSTLLLTVTNDDIIGLLGAAPTSDQNWIDRNNDNAGNVITSIKTPTSDKYRTMWYFGNPRGYLSNPPTAWSTMQNSEAFVYLHMFAGGNLTFDKVELSGSGFEFDNLVVSTAAQTPDPRLVFVTQFTSSQYAVRFEPNASSVDGTMPNQVGTSAAALTSNTYTRSGFTFAGWATSADGSGTSYSDGANYAFASDLTLYAQWTDNSQPTPGGGVLSAAATGPTLAATGVSGGLLPGLSALALILGLSLVAHSRRLRHRAVGGS